MKPLKCGADQPRLTAGLFMSTEREGGALAISVLREAYALAEHPVGYRL